tara:strand:- start:265 stop:669 length:405 start_codon:yes stop_codon:yes gene_type:complete
MKLLILHGPNMNLFGLRSAQKGDNLTLDKINRHIRKYIRKKNIDIKIIQTHNETKAVSYIQNNRNKFNGLILTPCSWNKSGYILNDLLELIQLKYVVVNLDKTSNNRLFSSGKIIFNDDVLISFEQALDYFNEK